MNGNLFTALPAELPGELTEALAHGEGVRIERILSRGHRSPEGFWYDQEENEWVMVVTGGARLRVERGGGVVEVEMNAGDWIELPAHTRHRVEWSDPERDTIWLAVFYR